MTKCDQNCRALMSVERVEVSDASPAITRASSLSLRIVSALL